VRGEVREDLNNTLQGLLDAEVGETEAKKALQNLMDQLQTPPFVHHPVQEQEQQPRPPSPPPAARARQNWANSTMRVAPSSNSAGEQWSYCDPPPALVPAGESEDLEMVVVVPPKGV
jgi:hypothetical protein